jgi:hypothetical protein
MHIAARLIRSQIALLILSALPSLAIASPATAALPSIPAPCRRPSAGIQFDDGSITHYTRARPILMQYGLAGSFAIVTGDTNVRPNAMTSHMLRQMFLLGYEFQDHTRTHNVVEWGDPTNAWQWPADIAFSESLFASIHPSLCPIRVWNQPGGEGEGFSSQLRDTLRKYGYTCAAGRVGLAWDQVMNFHYGLIDDPYSLGRCGVYAWTYNAPSEGWTWQAEVASIETRMADAVAQGLFPIIVFHSIADDAEAGLNAICSWLVAHDIDVLGVEGLMRLGQAP